MTDLVPQGRNDGHIFDYSKITEQIYIGSDMCKGGICLIHGEEFRRLGISVELNLSAENNELPPKNIESYLWIPVVDGFAPTQEQLLMGTCLMDTAINAGKIVYIHCKNGHARSPSLVVAYLVKYGRMNLDEAYALVKEKRPESHIEDIQKRAIEDFLKK